MNTKNTRSLVRKTCILLYFVHGPPVFRILGGQWLRWAERGRSGRAEWRPPHLLPLRPLLQGQGGRGQGRQVRAPREDCGPSSRRTASLFLHGAHSERAQLSPGSYSCPVQHPFRVLVCAARPLNATETTRITLYIAAVRAFLKRAAASFPCSWEGKGPDIRPNR